MNTEQLSVMMFTSTLDTGGATLSLCGSAPSAGLVVAVSKDTEKRIPKDKATAAAIQEYIEKHKDMLIHRWHYFGAWLDDDGFLVLDVVEVFPDRQLTAAIDAAVAREQEAIYHIGTGKVLRWD